MLATDDEIKFVPKNAVSIVDDQMQHETGCAQEDRWRRGAAHSNRLDAAHPNLRNSRAYFFAVPRRGGTVGRVWRARGSNNTVYSTGAKPTRVEGPTDSDGPLI